MGMYPMRQIGLDGNYKSPLPDFMVFLNWKDLPWTWAFSESFIAQMLLVILVPGLLALVFGWFAFRSRIEGVYFSIITQALTFAAMLLFFRNETGFGGNGGFTDFKRLLDLPIATSGMRITLFVVTGCTSWVRCSSPSPCSCRTASWVCSARPGRSRHDARPDGAGCAAARRL